MKKLIALIAVAMLVFTLSSCTTEEIEITIIVYSNDPEQTVSDLEDLPELLSKQLLELGYTHDRIVLQSSDELSVIEDSLINGTANLAIINDLEVESDSLVKVLSVVKEEIDHPDGDNDHTSYQKAVVVSPTSNGDVLKDHIEAGFVYDFTFLNNLEICTTQADEMYIEEFATYMGMDDTTKTLLDVSNTIGSTLQVFQGLENESCDMGIVSLEDIGQYQATWDGNETTIYSALTVLYVFEPVAYGGLYVSENLDGYLEASLIQSFIQISAHSSNLDILEVLGHDSYYIPE